MYLKPPARWTAVALVTSFAFFACASVLGIEELSPCADTGTCTTEEAGSAGNEQAAAAGAAGKGSSTLGAGGALSDATCSEEDSVACAGPAQQSRLICNEGVWMTTSSCGAGLNCDSATGECQKVASECANLTEGERFCRDDTVFACGPDSLSVVEVEECQQGCVALEGGAVCAVCGNREPEGQEECDDGNAATEVCEYGEDACTVCSESCRKTTGATSYCGDAERQDQHEQCDFRTNGQQLCTRGCLDASWAHWPVPAVSLPNQNYELFTWTVTDKQTGLIWQRRPDIATQRSWDEAKSYCEKLTDGDYDDWRLPSRIELISIRDYELSSGPAINTTAFPNMPSILYYWTASPVAGVMTSAWVVDFNWAGFTLPMATDTAQWVRCVR